MAGKSYLRVYPLNGDTPGVKHFIGVVENANIRGGAEASATAAATATAAPPGGLLFAASSAMGGDASSSGLEAEPSEGETSSDSALGSSATSGRAAAR